MRKKDIDLEALMKVLHGLAEETEKSVKRPTAKLKKLCEEAKRLTGVQETMSVEMYIGYTSGEWSTVHIDIPADTKESDLEKTAVRGVFEMIEDKCVRDVAFVGIYSYGVSD